jgi:hypothetical protein
MSAYWLDLLSRWLFANISTIWTVENGNQLVEAHRQQGNWNKWDKIICG